MVSAYSPARLAALAAFATLPLAAQAADIRVMCYQDGVECEVTAAIAKRGEAIAQAVSAQNGMPISVSVPLEGQFAPGVLQYYAELAKTF